MPETPDLTLLTLPEAAIETGLTIRALRHLVAVRALPVVRLGRSVRILRADLVAYISACTTPAAVAA